MTLVARQVTRGGPERLAPKQRIALITLMTEIKCCSEFGDVALDKIFVAAIAIAGEDQRPTPDELLRAVRAHEGHSSDPAVRLREQGRDTGVAKNVDPRKHRCLA